MKLCTTLALLSFLASPTEPDPAPGDVLACVPEGCHQLAYCEDFAGLRSRADRNDWVGLLRDENGALLLGELEQAYREGTQLEPDDLLPIASELRGEGVFFLVPGAACFFTAAEAPRDGVRAALAGWLPDPGPGGARNEIELGVARAEVVAWPASASGNGGRTGHFAALVEHPRFLGLVSADDLEVLTATLESVVPRLDGAEPSSVVRGFQAARATAQRGGVELFLDFSPYGGDAERLLERSAGGALPDPAGMLGLEEGTWLHARIDVQPGRRIDATGFLNVPKGTLAAQLADTFGALPADLGDRLPRGIVALWALEWDMADFYRVAREAFVERHGEDGFATVDGGVGVVEAMTGVDPLVELIGNLDGTLALYFTEPDRSIPGDERYIASIGGLLGLSNGEGFLDAFERLIDSTMESAFDYDEVAGAEIYTFHDEDWDWLLDEEGEPVAPGGVALLPREFVAAVTGGVLARQLRALRQEPDSSLASDARLGSTLPDGRGATFFSCVDLAWLHEAADLEGGRGPRSDTPDDDEAAVAGASLREHIDARLVSQVRRTEAGFDFSIEVR